MAPMAGLTTPAFRRSVRRWGAGLVFTEMISAYGVHYDNRRTLGLLRATGRTSIRSASSCSAPTPTCSPTPRRRAVAAGADLVDLNMACPVRKVVKTGAGAALLAEPDRAAGIVAAVVAAVEDAAPGAASRSPSRSARACATATSSGAATAPRLVAAGAAAVCIHPRTAAQLYRGRADHAVTFALAAELPVPVIASGDVDGRAAALALLDGGAAAVMLARGAVGAPWLFAAGARARPSRRPPRSSPRCAASRRRPSPSMGAPRRRPPAPVLAAGSAATAPSTRPLAQQLMQARDEAEAAHAARL